MPPRKKAHSSVPAPEVVGEPETENERDVQESGNSRKRPAARGTAFYPRKRANAACQVCRARKTKCDNRKPSCSYCLSVGAVCNQSPEDLSSFDPASLKILERLDVLERLMRQQGIQPTTRSEPSPSLAQLQGSGVECVPSSPSGEVRCDAPQLIDPTASVPRSCHQYGQNELPTSASGNNAPFLGVLPGSPDRLLRLGVFQRYRSSVGLIDNDSWKSYWTEKRPSKNEHQTDARVLGENLLTDNIKERRSVDELLDSFFTFVHCKNPILKEAATRRLVLSKAVHGVDESAQSCLSFLVCALGHLATPFDQNYDLQECNGGSNKAPCAEAEPLFYEAQRRIGTLSVDSGADSLIAPQCLILSGLYMMCTFRPFRAWQFFVQALAACQQFEFLRNMYHNEEIPSVHPSERVNQMAEPDSQEQAVYWTAWKSERELRRCLCLPDFPASGDTSHLYPPLFPTPPSIVSNSSVDQRRERASWLFYLAEISLRRLLSSVCDEISSLYRNNERETSFLARLAVLVPEYEQQGRRWAASLPKELSLEEPAKSDDICRFVLRGHYIDYCEVIYWPFLASQLNRFSSIPSTSLPLASLFQPTSPPRQEGAISPQNYTPAFRSLESPEMSQNSCSSPTVEHSSPPAFAQLVAKCLEIQVRRVHINYPGFKHRHHGTFLLIWSCTRSALILLAASLSGLAMPSQWHDSVNSTAGLLSFWEAEMPQLSKWRNLLGLDVSGIAEADKAT